MRRFVPLISFSSVALVVGGFILFTISIADPLERSLKDPFARGVVVPAQELRRRAPLYTYVALHAGTPGSIPESAVDDMLTEPDGRFALRADAAHGERFFVLARVETASDERYCVIRALPRLRAREDTWEVASTGEELPEMRIDIGLEDSCPD